MTTPPPLPHWDPPAGLHSQALFDDFIEKMLPTVRGLRLQPALPYTSGKVAFIVEHCHATLVMVATNTVVA